MNRYHVYLREKRKAIIPVMAPDEATAIAAVKRMIQTGSLAVGIMESDGIKVTNAEEVGRIAEPVPSYEPLIQANA
jgi:hypothetical protein